MSLVSSPGNSLNFSKKGSGCVLVKILVESIEEKKLLLSEQIVSFCWFQNSNSIFRNTSLAKINLLDDHGQKSVCLNLYSRCGSSQQDRELSVGQWVSCCCEECNGFGLNPLLRPLWLHTGL